MTDLLWLLPAFPLVGALVLMVFGRRMGEPRSGLFASAMPIASFLVTVMVYFDLLSRPSDERSTVVTLFEWMPVGSLQIDLALSVNLGQAIASSVGVQFSDKKPTVSGCAG
jgi:NADH-quinone oxidoreductase subunit L